jgi:hypothetical protein
MRNVRLFVEAKALGGDLDDRRWANQIMGSATVAGVEWIALTNGAEWRLYNAHAPVAVEEKLFRRVHLDDHQAAIETLELLAKNRLEDNRIEVLWRAHFVDRQVRAAIESLFTPDNNDMPLVNYVAKRTRNLTADEIRASIARCRVALDFPVDAVALMSSKPSPKRSAKADSDVRSPVQVGIGLADLIAAGLLKPPVEVRRTYRDKELTATVLPNGNVRIKSGEFPSLSTAAVEAIRAATGIERSTTVGLLAGRGARRIGSARRGSRAAAAAGGPSTGVQGQVVGWASPSDASKCAGPGSPSAAFRAAWGSAHEHRATGRHRVGWHVAVPTSECVRPEERQPSWGIFPREPLVRRHRWGAHDRHEENCLVVTHVVDHDAVQAAPLHVGRVRREPLGGSRAPGRDDPLRRSGRLRPAPDAVPRAALQPPPRARPTACDTRGRRQRTLGLVAPVALHAQGEISTGEKLREKGKKESQALTPLRTTPARVLLSVT